MAEGILMVQRNQNIEAVHQNELVAMLGVESHEIKFANCCPVYIANSETRNVVLSQSTVDKSFWLRLLFEKLSSKFPETSIQDCGQHLQIESFSVSVCSKEICPHRTTANLQCMPETIYFCCTWSTADEKLAWEIISVIKNVSSKR
ncbi:Cleavage and polyadenylation specificity factor subunit 3-II [Forsythia ovata]|uniref:Cleavage and polyadenylation specificity factor subunit 3-II n=1 Tax=Forsythia ovata TaxID=205694 RepID=A0ABD1TAY8_9LAMI